MTLKTGDKILKLDFQNIPDELKSSPHWLLWKAEPKMDKPDEASKIPVTIEGKEFTGWDDDKNLYRFEEVEKAFHTGNFDGVGFALASTEFICIKLENKISTDNISDELQKLLAFGYAEVSPSGKGYHIWLKGKKPRGMGNIGHTDAGEKLEVLGDSGWATVTGKAFWPFPEPIKENQSLLNNLYNFYFKTINSEVPPIKIAATSMPIPNLETIEERIFNVRKGKKLGTHSDLQQDLIRSNEEMKKALLEHIRTQEEFNRSLLKRLDKQQKYFEERFERERELTSWLKQSLLETQKQYQLQITAAQDEKKKGLFGRLFSK